MYHLFGREVPSALSDLHLVPILDLSETESKHHKVDLDEAESSKEAIYQEILAN